MGTSPSMGTLLRALATSCCSNPPMARVSPLWILTFDSSVRVSMIGLATVAPANTKVASPTLLLIFGLTFKVTKLSLLMLGVTMRVLPNFLSWNPPKTAVAVCSLKFSWGTGWARLISIFACKLSAVTTRGLARNSASLSSLRKRKVADICGTLRMANWPRARWLKLPKILLLAGLPRAKLFNGILPLVLVVEPLVWARAPYENVFALVAAR